MAVGLMQSTEQETLLRLATKATDFLHAENDLIQWPVATICAPAVT